MKGPQWQVLDADPQNTEVLNLLGILAFQAGNPEAAYRSVWKKWCRQAKKA